MTKSKLRTAPQFLYKYVPAWITCEEKYLLKAMRAYSAYKKEQDYEAWYRACQEQYTK